MSITVTGDGLDAIFAAIQDLGKADVLVGIPEGEARNDDAGASNAQIGYVMEHGSPDQNIPARPFLVPGVESVQDRISSTLGKAADAALDGNSQGVKRHLASAGMIAQNAVRAYIANGNFEPLSMTTIQARAGKGRKGAIKYIKQYKSDDETPDASLVKPLIDTGQMRKSITFVVREKKDADS